MQKEAALKAIRPEYHAAADGLAAAGFSWELIILILRRLAPILLDMLEEQTALKAALARAAEGRKHEECSDELCHALHDAMYAACETCCAVACACEEAGIEIDHDHERPQNKAP
jgi:hypothetical protein